MEKKRAQRIIGVTAAIALIVILLPVLFNKETTTQTSLQAPPFVEQPSQGPEATPSTAENTATPATDTTKPVLSENTVTGDQSTPKPNESNATPAISDTVPANSPAVTTSENAPQGPSPVVGVNPKSTAPVANNPSATPNNVNRDPNAILQDHTRVTSENNLRNAMQPVTDEETPVTVSSNENPIEISDAGNISTPAAKKTKQLSQSHTMIEKLKNPAWAVQMGSFKNKSNAERLVNSLRSKGFKAYLHEIKSASGSSTRVYVGPLFKRNAALSLAGKMQKETSIHGIVVSYKPLEI